MIVYGMSTVRGKYVATNNIIFSFFYQPKLNRQHRLRIKVVFNPDRMRESNASVQKLCDDWAFIYNDKREDINNELLRTTRDSKEPTRISF